MEILKIMSRKYYNKPSHKISFQVSAVISCFTIINFLFYGKQTVTRAIKIVVPFARA